MPLLRSTLTSPQKPPLLSCRSVAWCTKLRRRRSYVRGSIFLLDFCNHHCDRIIVALILIVLLHSRSRQYRHVRSLCLIICITVTSTPSVHLEVVLPMFGAGAQSRTFVCMRLRRAWHEDVVTRCKNCHAGDVALTIGRQQSVIRVPNKGCKEGSYSSKDQLPYR